MWYPNGILVQGLNDKTSFIKNFPYAGMNAYYSFPLLCQTDRESRELTKQQQLPKTHDYRYVLYEFIKDADLYQRYIKKCAELQISIRSLFIESNYDGEIWNGPLPAMKLLGYEYCPFPVDEQIITDLDWYKGFSKFWSKLNENGLFDTCEDLQSFVEAYAQAFLANEVGDGDADMYVCKVSILI